MDHLDRLSARVYRGFCVTGSPAQEARTTSPITILAHASNPIVSAELGVQASMYRASIVGKVNLLHFLFELTHHAHVGNFLCDIVLLASLGANFVSSSWLHFFFLLEDKVICNLSTRLGMSFTARTLYTPSFGYLSPKNKPIPFALHQRS